MVLQQTFQRERKREWAAFTMKETRWKNWETKSTVRRIWEHDYIRKRKIGKIETRSGANTTILLKEKDRKIERWSEIGLKIKRERINGGMRREKGETEEIREREGGERQKTQIEV